MDQLDQQQKPEQEQQELNQIEPPSTPTNANKRLLESTPPKEGQPQKSSPNTKEKKKISTGDVDAEVWYIARRKETLSRLSKNELKEICTYKNIKYGKRYSINDLVECIVKEETKDKTMIYNVYDVHITMVNQGESINPDNVMNWECKTIHDILMAPEFAKDTILLCDNIFTSTSISGTFNVIFNSFKDDIIDVGFYQSLFTKYGCYIRAIGVQYFVESSIKSNCNVALAQLISLFKFRVSHKELQIAFNSGSPTAIATILKSNNNLTSSLLTLLLGATNNFGKTFTILKIINELKIDLKPADRETITEAIKETTISSSTTLEEIVNIYRFVITDTHYLETTYVTEAIDSLADCLPLALTSKQIVMNESKKENVIHLLNFIIDFNPHQDLDIMVQWAFKNRMRFKSTVVDSINKINVAFGFGDIELIDAKDNFEFEEGDLVIDSIFDYCSDEHSQVQFINYIGQKSFISEYFKNLILKLVIEFDNVNLFKSLLSFKQFKESVSSSHIKCIRSVPMLMWFIKNEFNLVNQNWYSLGSFELIIHLRLHLNKRNTIYQWKFINNMFNSNINTDSLVPFIVDNANEFSNSDSDFYHLIYNNGNNKLSHLKSVFSKTSNGIIEASKNTIKLEEFKQNGSYPLELVQFVRSISVNQVNTRFNVSPILLYILTGAYDQIPILDYFESNDMGSLEQIIENVNVGVVNFLLECYFHYHQLLQLQKKLQLLAI